MEYDFKSEYSIRIFKTKYTREACTYNLPATMKMSTSIVKPLFLAFAIAILGLAPGLRAQNITATIGSVNSSTCAVGDTLVIPVTAVMGSGISTSAISLAIDYDSTKLQCISSVTGLNSAISAGFLSNCGLFSNLSPNAPFSASNAQAVQGRLVCVDAGYRERNHVQSAIQGSGNRKYLGELGRCNTGQLRICGRICRSDSQRFLG